MTHDPADAAIEAATVTLPLSRFNALVLQARRGEEFEAKTQTNADDKDAVLTVLAEVLSVKYHKADHGMTGDTANLAAIHGIMLDAGFTNDDGEVLPGAALQAMRERLRKLEMVADAARRMLPVVDGELPAFVFSELAKNLRDLPGEVAF